MMRNRALRGEVQPPLAGNGGRGVSGPRPPLSYQSIFAKARYTSCAREEADPPTPGKDAISWFPRARLTFKAMERLISSS